MAGVAPPARVAAARVRLRQHADRTALSGVRDAVHRVAAGDAAAPGAAAGIGDPGSVDRRTDDAAGNHAAGASSGGLCWRDVGGGVVLVPRGNDGVGIVGAFAIEVPPARCICWSLVAMSPAADPRAAVAVSARGARTDCAGCRQPCNAAAHARGVRGTRAGVRWDEMAMPRRSSGYVRCSRGSMSTNRAAPPMLRIDLSRKRERLSERRTDRSRSSFTFR